MNKTLIWIIVEIALIVFGTGQFVSSLCNCCFPRSYSSSQVGLGAAMIVLGYLIGKKRTEYTERQGD